jgi:hypothetical protein
METSVLALAAPDWLAHTLTVSGLRARGCPRKARRVLRAVPAEPPTFRQYPQRGIMPWVDRRAKPAVRGGWDQCRDRARPAVQGVGAELAAERAQVKRALVGRNLGHQIGQHGLEVALTWH